MNPDEIRESINKNMGDSNPFEEENENSEENGPKKYSIPYVVGYLIGLGLIVGSVYLSWREVAPKFGLPDLTLVEFFLFSYIVYAFSRLFKSNPKR